MKIKLWLLTALFLFFTSICALAETTLPTETKVDEESYKLQSIPSKETDLDQKIFDVLDVNGDGVLSADESQGPELMLKIYTVLDADGDDLLTIKEYQGPDSMFHQIDADGDGYISIENVQDFYKTNKI